MDGTWNKEPDTVQVEMAWEARGLSEEVSEDKERGIRTEENYNSYRVQAHLLTT